MLFSRKGMPEEGDIVFCTVTKIQYNSVFVKLDEFENTSGMIHISEISPGRIRNIRNYVKENKVIVCKVLRINKSRGHIDLSLRRVNENQRREKVEERKQQVIAENILHSYCKLHDKDIKEVYQKVSTPLLESYPSLYKAFEDVVENGADLTEEELDKTLAQELLPLIKERIKPKEVSIESRLNLQSYDGEGVDKINAINKKILESYDKVELQFLGSGSFKLMIKARVYEEAEEMFSTVESILEENTDGSTTTYKLERE